MDDKKIEKVKKMELEMFIEFDNICRKNNIKYFLGASCNI